MSSPPPSDRAARGRALLAARARRVARLRRRVVAATLSTFVLAWGMIAWQGSLGAETTGTATAQVRQAAATATPTATATATPTATAAPDLTTSQS